MQIRVTLLQKQMKRVKREKRELIKNHAKCMVSLRKLFTDDQLRALGRKSMRGSKWSANTIKKALQLRFACGSTGYEQLLEQQFPLPSLRTLRRQMQGVVFELGVLYEVFSLLQLKV